jgi:hypothetical protein|tara:strand:+ start:197 stop:1078 length:882 start_codon:yes stop_codon:yes gene_type:complete
MKNTLQMEIYSFSRYLMKYSLTILILFVFTSNVFSQECDETTRARMIKSGLSDKTIEEQCGKIGEQVESKDTVEEEKVSEEDPSEDKRWRFSGGSGSGTFKYTNSSVPELNGKFDHDLSGGTFTLSYFMLDEDNFFAGGGVRSITVSGPETFSTDKVPGYYTYYSSTYGYFDPSITVTSFRSTFLHGIYGYNYVINNEMSFQPNLRYGYDFVVAEWETKIDWYSYTDEEEKNATSFHGFGLDIVLPFVYKINKEFSTGIDICLCGASGEITEGTEKYEFSNINAFNIFFDYHL